MGLSRFETRGTQRLEESHQADIVQVLVDMVRQVGMRQPMTPPGTSTEPSSEEPPSGVVCCDRYSSKVI